MSSLSEKNPANHSRFVFIGDHPAIDFANTLVLADGEPLDNFGEWADVVKWLSLAGLSKDSRLQVPASHRAEALKSVGKLRKEWKAQLESLVAGGDVEDAFLARINGLLGTVFFIETLQRGDKDDFHFDRSFSELSGAQLALNILARQIAQFLAEANLNYLHRCANTTSCVLYFYDTTKNHRRQWCSVATCGNRHKVAEFRKRQSKGKV